MIHAGLRTRCNLVLLMILCLFICRCLRCAPIRGFRVFGGWCCLLLQFLVSALSGRVDPWCPMIAIHHCWREILRGGRGRLFVCHDINLWSSSWGSWGEMVRQVVDAAVKVNVLWWLLLGSQEVRYLLVIWRLLTATIIQNLLLLLVAKLALWLTLLHSGNVFCAKI